MTSQTKATLGKLRRSTLLLGFLPLMLTAQQVAPAQEQIARVVNLRGEWVLNSSQKLKAGMPLPASGIVQALDPGNSDYIEIADRSGRIIINRRCGKESCNGSMNLPATSSPGIISRLFGAAMDLLNNGPNEWVVLISRGGELREAVVKIADKQVDLSAVLENKRRGKYVLRFEPRGATAAANSKPVGPITVDWNPGKSARVFVKGLSPGLYVVQLLDNSGQTPLEPGSESMVLFATPKTFDKAFSEFHDATVLTEMWGDSVHPTSKNQFLRAALGVLASEAR